MKIYRALFCAFAAALFALTPPVPAATLVATIYGAYDTPGMSVLPSSVTSDPNTSHHYNDSSAYDTPSLYFVNPTGYSITGAQMVLSVTAAANSGQNTLNNGVTQTVGLGTLNPNSITQLSWGSGGPLFNNDYDDSYGNNNGAGLAGNSGNHLADCTLTDGASPPHPEWHNFCAPTGSFAIAFSGTLSGSGGLNGQAVAAGFGEYDINANYTGWEGLDPLGWSENLSYDVHTGSVNGVLANIYLGDVGTVPTSPIGGAPEPGALLLAGAGLGALILFRRR